MSNYSRLLFLLLPAALFVSIIPASQSVLLNASTEPAALEPTPPAAGSSRTPLSSEERAIESLRAQLAQRPHRGWELPRNMDKAALNASLATGRFADLGDVETEEFQAKLRSDNWSVQASANPRMELVFDRIWLLAENLRGQPRPLSAQNSELQERLFRAIIHYGALEQKRPNFGARFHASCFAIPLAAVNSYFSFLPEMNAVEADKAPSALATQAHQTLLALGMQSWTVPARKDATDAEPISVGRFRKHVWWVGGNALTYRPVFPVAVMHRSPEKVKVLAQVASGALSYTSASAIDVSFWTEGMTTDGSGWAHGRQNQPFAYPLHGTESALEILESLKGSPWEKPLTANQIEVLMNYVRGSSWFYYKGYNPPVIYRSNMVFGYLGPKSLESSDIARLLLRGWRGQLTTQQVRELESLTALSSEKGAFPAEVERTNYRGARYFWNQDALAVKSDTHYMLVNMASKRKDGLESTLSPATSWNFFTNDGHTLFYRDGKEYSEAIGAWNLTAIPGVTARQGEDQLKPVTNWKGYNSLSNFAGGVTRGANGCAGFIFEKHNASCATHTNGQCGADDPNPILYGVKARKAWFVLGNSMLALGSGITDTQKESKGNIWTTINQTTWRTDVVARDATGKAHQAPRPDGSSMQWLLSKPGDKTKSMVSHDGFTYTILPQYTTGQVKVALERRATKWNTLAADNKKLNTPAQADIFQLWIDHGNRPQGANYAYVVSAADEKISAEVSPQEEFVVLSNSEALQAVRSADKRVIQAVFYDASASLLVDGTKLSVSAPCVLMIEKSASGDEWTLTVNDPEQLASKRTLQIVTNAPLIGSGVTPVSAGRRGLSITLPETPYLGQPATVKVQVGKSSPR